MKGNAKGRFPDLDVLLFPSANKDAEPSHGLLFMSERARGVVGFLLSSGSCYCLSHLAISPQDPSRSFGFIQQGVSPLLRSALLRLLYISCNTVPEPKMMKNGSLAVAIVHRQVVVVKGEEYPR